MLKKTVLIILHKLGYKLIKIQPEIVTGKNPFEDMFRFLNNKSNPVIFDIGANVGQSINQFVNYFPSCEITSFEPGPKPYSELLKNYKNKKNVHLVNIAIGSENEKKEFLENEFSDMSSFLDLNRLGWGKVENKIVVDTVSVDNYCKANHITKIDILKSDTQGFELEVFKGAIQMMKSNNIHLVYFEFIFSDMYKELPSFHEIYKLLTDNNFRLVNFYDFRYQEGMLSWADLLFVNSKYNEANS